MAGDDLDIAALAAARRKERADSRANKASASQQQFTMKQHLATAAMSQVSGQTKQPQQAQHLQQAQHGQGQWQPPRQQDFPLQGLAPASQLLQPGGANVTHTEQPPAALAPSAPSDTAQSANSYEATAAVSSPDSGDRSRHAPNAVNHPNCSPALQQEQSQQQQRPLPSPDRIAEPRSDLSPQTQIPQLLPSVAERSASKAAQTSHATISSDSQSKDTSIEQLVGAADHAAIADKSGRGGDDSPAAQDAAARTIWQQLRSRLGLPTPESATSAEPPLRVTEAEAKTTMKLPSWAPFSSGGMPRVTAAQRMRRRRLLHKFNSLQITTTAADVLPAESTRLPPPLTSQPVRSPAAALPGVLREDAMASTHTQLDEASQPQADINYQPEDDINHQPQDDIKRQLQDDVTRQHAATAEVSKAPLESHSLEPNAAAIPEPLQPAQMPPETLPAGKEQATATQATQDTAAEQKGAADEATEADDSSTQSLEGSAAVGTSAVPYKDSSSRVEGKPSLSDAESPPSQHEAGGKQQQLKAIRHSAIATDGPESRMERRADNPWKDGVRSRSSRVGPDRYVNHTSSGHTLPKPWHECKPVIPRMATRRCFVARSHPKQLPT